MIAKFHSAPGHSMETTLTISLPPPQSVRAARGELPREKQKDKEKERKRERDDDKERERDIKERDRVREREKDAKEHDRERAGKTVSYKDKFQRMRERYDRVTATHETHQRDLDILNAKIKKLQAENDLLLDAMYMADEPLYERYFPGHLATPSAIPPNFSLPIPNQHLAQPRFPEQYPPPVPHHSIPQYTSAMPPPGSMPPPPHSSSSTSIPPGLIPPSLPPHPLLPQSAMNMPPPLSSASNGTIGNNFGRGSSSRRESNASSRSRRRSDARASMSSMTGIPLAPDDIGANANEPSGGGTPRGAATPTRNPGLDPMDDLPLRSPRVNGGPAAPLDRRTPNMPPNGVSPSVVGPRATEIPYAMPIRDGEIVNSEAFPDERPGVDDNPAYNMNAYAAVNSPDEPDEDMHVDV